jgi:hypothetical protein
MRLSAKIDSRGKRIGTLVDLYKTGIELGLPESQRVSAAEVVDEALLLKRDVAIRPHEIEIMRRLGLQERVPLKSLRADVLFNSTNGEPLGLLEATFRQVMDNRVPRLEAEGFAKAMINMGHFLFPPGHEIERVARAQYRPMALDSDLEETRFDEAIQAREAQPVADDERRFIYALDSDGRPLAFESPRSAAGGATLLPANARRDYRAIIEAFHVEKTAGYFRALQPEDPEYGSGSERSTGEARP